MLSTHLRRLQRPETKQVSTGAGGLGEVTVIIPLVRFFSGPEEADTVRLASFSDAHLCPQDIWGVL